MEKKTMGERRTEYFAGVANEQMKLWKRMQTTQLFGEFMDGLDEEQRERVKKFFPRAVECLMVRVSPFDAEENFAQLEFAFPMTMDGFSFYWFVAFIKAVLNPRGDKEIPYYKLFELFPQTYLESRSRGVKELADIFKEEMEEGPIIDETIIKSMIFFDEDLPAKEWE